MEAEKFAPEVESGAVDSIQLVGFKLDEELYAIDVLKIEEIIRFAEITAVPRRENFVLGVMNLRGKIIPVVDLRIRFNLDKFDFDKDTCIIVVKFDSEHIGFVVDSVVKVMRVDLKMINPNPPLVGTIGQEYILGIYRYNDDLVFVLDIDRVVFAGNKYKDSYLKKLIYGSMDVEKESREKRQLLQTDTKQKANEGSKEEESQKTESSYKSKDDKTTDEFNEEVASAGEKFTRAEETEKQEGDVEDIDRLIVEELKKREKETEELIQKKKKKDQIKTDKKEDNKNNVSVEQTEEKEESSESNKSIDEMMEKEIEEKEKKKEIIQNEQDLENIDLDELKRISKNIIEGSDDNLDKEISTEIASIVGELRKAKDKYEDFINILVSSHRTFPKIEEHLNDINEITSKSTDMLFDVIEGLNHFYEELLKEIDDMQKNINEGNMAEFLKKINYYENCITEYAEVALKVYETLEFEDITSQKINRVLKLVSDVTARFGSILGYIKDKKKTDYVLLSQEEINNILKNMGLE